MVRKLLILKYKNNEVRQLRARSSEDKQPRKLVARLVKGLLQNKIAKAWPSAGPPEEMWGTDTTLSLTGEGKATLLFIVDQWMAECGGCREPSPLNG